MATTTITPGIVGTILWVKTNAAHHDHLHVEPPSRMTGTPPASSSMSEGVKKIYDELTRVFGAGAYLDDSGGWSHMGWFNRRYIAGTTTWSQHAWGNALDIGPYYGVEQQQKFYDFLTGKEIEVAHSIKDHAVYHGQGPNPWGDGAWAAYKAAKYTTVDESRTWEVRREDLAWFREKVLAEVQASSGVDVDAIVEQVVAAVIKRLSNG